jgi:hypothetical protein
MKREEVACRNCRYFAQHDMRGHQCRRRSPRPNKYYTWPTIAGDDWCGEFERGEPMPRQPLSQGSSNVIR